MRAAIYLRRSEMGEEDKNSSIETQRKETTELAQKNGNTVVEEYPDPGGRSMTLNRPSAGCWMPLGYWLLSEASAMLIRYRWNGR